MILFFIIFFSICVFLFCALCYLDFFHRKRERDPVFDKKVIKFFEKIDPYEKFFYNLFGWILAALVFYFIYLG
jgi:hypothetical protein